MSGGFCPQPLTGLGYACGRPIDIAGGLGLCADHTAEALEVEQRQSNAHRMATPPRPPKPPCPCGETHIYAVGQCRSCYQRRYKRPSERAAEAERKAKPSCIKCGAKPTWMGGECARCWRDTCRERRRAAWRAEQAARQAELRP